MSGPSVASATQRRVGAALHSAVGELAAARGRLSAPLVLAVAARHALRVAASSQARIGAQHVAPLASIAVRMFPPDPWRFAGAELTLVGSRVDLVWQHRDSGQWLIDELKIAGVGRVIEDVDVRDQIRRYREAGASCFGDAFVGVRLLTLAQPDRSRLYPPVEGHRRLTTTPWWWFNDRPLGYAWGSAADLLDQLDPPATPDRHSEDPDAVG